MIMDLQTQGIAWADQDREGRAMWTAWWERVRVPMLIDAGVRFGQ